MTDRERIAEIISMAAHVDLVPEGEDVLPGQHTEAPCMTCLVAADRILALYLKTEGGDPTGGHESPDVTTAGEEERTGSPPTPSSAEGQEPVAWAPIAMEFHEGDEPDTEAGPMYDFPLSRLIAYQTKAQCEHEHPDIPARAVYLASPPAPEAPMEQESVPEGERIEVRASIRGLEALRRGGGCCTVNNYEDDWPGDRAAILTLLPTEEDER